MDNIWLIGLIGLLTGVLGTGLGALGIIGIKRISEFLLSIVLGISAGVMSSIIFLDLIPEALEIGTLFSSIFGILLGVVTIGILDLRFPHKHFSLSEEGAVRYLKMGLLLGIGIAMHNIPEGLAIGAGFIASESLGIRLSILMALHNFPEGLAMATALGLAGLKGRTILFYTALAGVPMGLGALIGAFFGTISEFALAVSLGFAGGAMLYIVFDELIPDAHARVKGHQAIIGIISGVILGIIFNTLLH